MLCVFNSGLERSRFLKVAGSFVCKHRKELETKDGNISKRKKHSKCRHQNTWNFPECSADHRWQSQKTHEFTCDIFLCQKKQSEMFSSKTLDNKPYVMRKAQFISEKKKNKVPTVMYTKFSTTLVFLWWCQQRRTYDAFSLHSRRH